MNWKHHIEKLQKGETTTFRPKGNSMQPKIESGEQVTVEPAKGVSCGDIVFCKVKGKHYVHLVKSIKTVNDKKLYLIGNNKKGINGWVGLSAIFGKVTKIDP